MTEPEKHFDRSARLRWVRVRDMKVSPKAQAAFNKTRAERIAAKFDPELLGYLVVSYREGHWYLIDGQHRRAAFIIWHGDGWEDQALQCEAYEGLSERDEAKKFLGRNDKRNPSAFDKFTVALTAESEPETDIHRIVMAAGLKIGHERGGDSIGCVTALQDVYRQGGEVLARTVRLGRDSFRGDPAAFSPAIIRGLGLVCQRYNGSLDDDDAIRRLSTITAHELGQRANVHKQRLGRTLNDCMAAAIIDVVNKGRRGKAVLPSWWS